MHNMLTTIKQFKWHLIAMVILLAIHTSIPLPGVEEVTQKLPAEAAKFVMSYEQGMIKARTSLIADLKKTVTKCTKAGDLAGANAVNTKLAELESENQSQSDLLGNKLAAVRKPWASGTWEVVWAGFRCNVSFLPDNVLKRQDGVMGAVSTDEKGVITLTWEDALEGGNIWVVQPPEKGASERSLGKNAKGTTFQFTKQ